MTVESWLVIIIIIFSDSELWSSSLAPPVAHQNTILWSIDDLCPISLNSSQCNSLEDPVLGNQSSNKLDWLDKGEWVPGGRLNKKDGLTRYGNSHVKDKTS